MGCQAGIPLANRAPFLRGHPPTPARLPAFRNDGPCLRRHGAAPVRGSDMRFPSGLGPRLLALAAAAFVIGPTDASARPSRHHTAAATQSSSCFLFFCPEQSPARSRADARRQAAEKTAQARQAAAEQRAARRQISAEARLGARTRASIASSDGSYATPATTERKGVETIIGGRPAGCPFQFCGCGASIEVFGRIIPRYNLAANWFRDFPRVSHANASANMVAGNSSHVFVLKEHRRDDVWLVKDFNSGGHRTRLHERKLSSYTVVDPRGGHVAAAAALAD